MTPSPDFRRRAELAPDELLEQGFKLRLLLAGGLILLGAGAALVIADLFSGQLRGTIGGVRAFYLTAALSALACHRYQRADLGWSLLISMAFVGVTWAVYHNGGVQAPAVIGYAVIIVVGGRMLGMREFLALSLGCVAVLLGVGYLQYTGQLPPSEFTPGPLRRVATLIVMIAMLGLLAYLISRQGTLRRGALLDAHERASRASADASAREAQRAQSEAKLAAIFETSPEPLAIARARDGVHLAVNDAWCRMTGHAREHALGRSALELGLWVQPSDRQAMLDAIDKQGELAGFETRFARADGSTIEARLSCRRVMLDGEPCLTHAWQDITLERRHRRLLEDIVLGTAQASGEAFFDALAENLARAFGVRHAMVAELVEGGTRARALAFRDGEAFAPDFSYPIASAPCALVIANGEAYYEHSVARLFPGDKGLDQRGIQGYYGVALSNVKGERTGLLAVMHTAPLALSEEQRAIMRVFATRAAVELERERAEQALLESEDRFQQMFHRSLVPQLVTDADTRIILDLNEAFIDLLGYARDQLIGRGAYEAGVYEDAGAEPMVLREILARDGWVDQFEVRYRRADGGRCVCLLSGRPIQVAQKRMFVWSFIDITERKRSVEALELASMVYRHSSEAMMVADADNRIIAVNRAFTDVTGYATEEVMGKDPRMLQSDRHDPAFYEAMWNALDSTGRWQGELWNRRKNGEVYPESLTINTIRHEDGSVHRYVAMFSDITEKKESEILIWQQANFDELTGLPNRRMFGDRLDQAVKKSKRNELTLALLFIDLDRFKEVNDAFGHATGDQLLIEAAARIRNCVRESDTVARLGGDEFTVILSELNDPGRVDAIAQGIISALAVPFALGQELAFVSASVGITMYPEDAAEIEDLLKHADQALYAAKNAGRNRFSYFTAPMQVAAQNRLRLTADLRRALPGEQFSVYFQPIVHLASGRIDKAEALIRWRHPERGLITPAEFIPLAEANNLIIDIGEWVFKESARWAQRWRTGHNSEFQISVNLSPMEFYQEHDRHAERLAHLHALGLPGKSIVMEITEGLLLDGSAAVMDHLREFRAAGIQVALDDFGTGYSSLSYLKRFDIDFLKIDQSFVCNLASASSDMALCEAIIVMAHKLDLLVIAEGVETTMQRDLLAAAGCDYVQGYLLAPPMPAEEFEKRLYETQGAD